jgi:hypothetical protein
MLRCLCVFAIYVHIAAASETVAGKMPAWLAMPNTLSYVQPTDAYVVYEQGVLRDGVGAQAVWMLISQCVVMHSKNVEYIHQNFQQISHDGGEQLSAWEAYLRLGYGYLNVHDIEKWVEVQNISTNFLAQNELRLKPGVYRLDRYHAHIGGSRLHQNQYCRVQESTASLSLCTSDEATYLVKHGTERC